MYELKSDFWKAKLSLADVFLQERDYPLAQKECEEILEKNPDNYEAQLLLGNAFALQGKAGEAEKQYQSLIGASPDKPMAYYRLGLLQRSQKKYDSAIENMNKALSIDPMRMDVFTNLVLVHAERKNVKQAMVLCDEQIKKAEGKSDALALIHDVKGNLFLMQKRTAEAEEELRGGGPAVVVTDVGILKPLPESKESALCVTYPSIPVEGARAAIGWPLALASQIGTIEAPTASELAALRALEARTEAAHRQPVRLPI